MLSTQLPGPWAIPRSAIRSHEGVRGGEATELLQLHVDAWTSQGSTRGHLVAAAQEPLRTTRDIEIDARVWQQRASNRVVEMRLVQYNLTLLTSLGYMSNEGAVDAV